MKKIYIYVTFGLVYSCTLVLLCETKMRETLASHKTASSLAFLIIPLLLFEYVTCLFVGFVMGFISIFPRPAFWFVVDFWSWSSWSFFKYRSLGIARLLSSSLSWLEYLRKELLSILVFGFLVWRKWIRESCIEGEEEEE